MYKALNAARRIKRRFGIGSPFGTKPWAPEETYLSLWNQSIHNRSREVDEFVAHHGNGVDDEWLNDLALHTQVVIKQSPLDWNHGRVLYTALRTRLQTADCDSFLALETGTARGFSAIVMGRAMIDAEAPGVLVTVDRLPHRTPMIWNCIRDHEGPQTRESLLRKWPDERARILFVEQDVSTFLDTIDLPRLNFAFLDGKHDYKSVMDEFHYVAERQTTNDVLVLDDVTPGYFDGVCRAVDSIGAEGTYHVHRISSSSSRAYAILTRL